MSEPRYTLKVTQKAKSDIEHLRRTMRAKLPEFAPKWFAQVQADIESLPHRAPLTFHPVDGGRLTGRDLRYTALGRKGRTQLRAFVDVQGPTVTLLRVQPSRERPMELKQLARQARSRGLSM